MNSQGFETVNIFCSSMLGNDPNSRETVSQKIWLNDRKTTRVAIFHIKLYLVNNETMRKGRYFIKFGMFCETENI